MAVVPIGTSWQLPLVDTSRWIGAKPPERRFIVDGWLARGTAALLVGEDGIGKSLLAQQLATCVATGRPFLGMDVEQAAALYLTCEDDDDELWRRQRAINTALGLPIDAAPAMLSSLVGVTGVDLGFYDQNGAFQLSEVAKGIVSIAKSRGAGLIVLDNLAHLFPGNENVRRDVAQFCAMLDRIAIDADATVLVLGHPSKGGAEYSGSTGWSAHVRQRWFLERGDDPEAGIDRDARVLRKSKANYSASGVEIAFRWQDWAFVVEGQDNSPRAGDALDLTAGKDNDIFLRCLAERNKQRRAVSERPSSTYAQTQFDKMPESQRIGKHRLEKAMDRLFRLGRVERRELWKGADRKPVFGLAEAAGYVGNAAGHSMRETRGTMRNTAEIRAVDAGDGAGDSAGNTLRETRATLRKPAEILAGDAGDTPPYTTYRDRAADAAALSNPDDDIIWDHDR